MGELLKLIIDRLIGSAVPVDGSVYPDRGTITGEALIASPVANTQEPTCKSPGS